MQFNPAVQHRVLGTCICFLLFLSFLFHDTGDVVVLCADTLEAFIAKASYPYHAALAVAQLAVDCLISSLDWITDFATRFLRSAGIIETLPIPDDVFITKKALNERCRSFPSRAWAQRNRAGTLEGPGSPTPTGPAPLPSQPRLVSSPLSEKASDFDTNYPSLAPPTSRDVDTSSSTWKLRKPDYWSTVRSAQVSAPVPKTGFRGNLGASARREAARLDAIAEDSSEATIPGSNTTSALIATSPSPIIPPATTNTAIERPAGAGTQDAAGEPRTPHDSGAALATQVGGEAQKTGLFGELRLEVAAAVASASRSRPVVQANINRIKNASRRPGFKSSDRKRREAAVAPLDTIAEELSDSTTIPSADAPTPIATSSAEGTEDKPKKVVTFSDKVQVLDVPMSMWDELARREFISEEEEGQIEAAYWAWVKEEKKVLPRVKAMLKRIRAKINARRFATSDRWVRARAVFRRGTA